MRLILAAVLLISLVNCGNSSEANLRNKILAKEEAIASLSNKLEFGKQIDPQEDTELINLLLEFYHTYPESPYAPECLDKVQMKYTGLGDYRNAVLYADTLLIEYKDYINRAMILENQASTYDAILSPRDTSKVRYYNELLLKEFPNLPKEKVDGIKFRLKNLHLTIEEIMMMQIESFE